MAYSFKMFVAAIDSLAEMKIISQYIADSIIAEARGGIEPASEEELMQIRQRLNRYLTGSQYKDFFGS